MKKAEANSNGYPFKWKSPFGETFSAVFIKKGDR